MLLLLMPRENERRPMRGHMSVKSLLVAVAAVRRVRSVWQQQEWERQSLHWDSWRVCGGNACSETGDDSVELAAVTQVMVAVRKVMRVCKSDESVQVAAWDRWWAQLETWWVCGGSNSKTNYDCSETGDKSNETSDEWDRWWVCGWSSSETGNECSETGDGFNETGDEGSETVLLSYNWWIRPSMQCIKEEKQAHELLLLRSTVF